MLASLRQLRADRGYERWTKRTDGPLLILAVAFVVVLLLPFVRDLSPVEASVVRGANAVIWAVFAVDYFARLYLARQRGHFVRTRLLDLVIVILPMLRPLRALRVFRLLRLSSVATYAHGRASRSIYARVSTYVVSGVLVAVLVAGVGIREAERGAADANIDSVADGLWWGATTITTVGYGDRYPTTTLGRLIAVALMLIGIALLGVVTATIAGWFVQRLSRVQATVTEVEARTEATIERVLTELQEKVFHHRTGPPAWFISERRHLVRLRSCCPQTVRKTFKSAHRLSTVESGIGAGHRGCATSSQRQPPMRDEFELYYDL